MKVITSLLKRALVQAKIPTVNEPSNLPRSDGRLRGNI